MSMGSVKNWLLASRPKTLLASFAPVLIGTSMAYAGGSFHTLTAVVTLLAAVLIQTGTNYSNDYCDFLKGADTEDRKGPLRVTQAGLIDASSMRNATVIVFLLAIICGLYLVFRGGWPILLIGLLSVLFGVLYTAGRYSLAYLGIADLFVFVFFGPVAVAGTYYLQTLEISMVVIMAGIPCGLISVAILTVNNLRDVNEDRKAGKKTPAVRFGSAFATGQYIFCMAIATMFPLLIYFLSDEKIYSLLALLVVPLSFAACKTVVTFKEAGELNKMLGYTARVLFLYSLLFAVGWNLS